jgi:hypothetical protein
MEKQKCDVCREFGLANSVSKRFGEREPKLLGRSNGRDRE